MFFQKKKPTCLTKDYLYAEMYQVYEANACINGKKAYLLDLSTILKPGGAKLWISAVAPKSRLIGTSW